MPLTGLHGRMRQIDTEQPHSHRPDPDETAKKHTSITDAIQTEGLLYVRSYCGNLIRRRRSWKRASERNGSQMDRALSHIRRGLRSR